MQLAGIDITTTDALELIAMLCASGRTTTADTLATAWGEGDEIVGLTMHDRDQILCALDDPPSGLRDVRTLLKHQYALDDCRDALCDLRAVLMQQWAWRRHVGL